MKKPNKNIQPRNVIIEKNKVLSQKEIGKFLLSKEYKIYPETVNWPYEFKNLYQRRVKDEVETEVVCETNDRLFINIVEAKFVNTETINYPSYTIEIVAERNGLWWTLNSYGLDGNDLFVRLEEVEKTLIKLFNEI